MKGFFDGGAAQRMTDWVSEPSSSQGRLAGVIMTAALLVAGCAGGPAPAADTAGEMRAALARLLQRASDDAFVVFTVPGTDKFVQFETWEGELVFDLPQATLDAAELQRARRHLLALGVELKELPSFNASGKQTGTIQTFSKVLGRDLDQATRLALLVVAEIYLADLRRGVEIEEN